VRLPLLLKNRRKEAGISNLFGETNMDVVVEAYVMARSVSITVSQLFMYLFIYIAHLNT
jgi:hypothetical protein